MGWSWTVGKLFGIDFKIHTTFLFILLWVGFTHYQKGEGWVGVAEGVLFMLALFGCVVLHELGHALAARRYGIGTKDITLLPMGGVARLESIPEDPRQEMVVALAGPAVNVVIAAVLYAGLSVLGGWQDVDQLSVAKGSFAERLMIVNLFLVAFNLLPAFPMDGGRVLRAFLATRTDYARATRTAANVGQGMALMFGLLGLMYNPFLIFIALFVWIGAEQEASMVQVKSALGGIPVRQAMQTHYRTLTANDSLDNAVQMILTGSQQDFPVVDGRAVIGLLTRADLFNALAQQKAVIVGQVMQEDFPVATPADPLEESLRKLQASGLQTLVVVDGGELQGLVTTENIGEFLMIHSARRGGMVSG